MLHILHVEDDPSAVARLEKGLQQAGVVVTIDIANSRAEALAAIEANRYDLIVCDLRIPTVVGALDANEAHGISVLEHARNVSAGTPLLVLSAFGTLPLLSSFLAAGEVADCFGARSGFRMADESSKDELEKAIRILHEASSHIDALDLIDINYGIGGRFLSATQERILKIFARRIEGNSIDAAPLAGGMSGTVTLRCAVTGSTAGATVAARLSTIPNIEDERGRYQRFLPATLDPGTYVAYADQVTSGAGPEAGIFYRLADHFSISLFRFAIDRPTDAAETVSRLEEIEKPWREQRQGTNGTVAELRRSLIADEEFARVAKFGPEDDWRAFESQRVRSWRLCQHGDLHPLNVLVDEEGVPILIDFGRLGESPAALDAVTLELGALFHPDTRASLRGWPRAGQAQDWMNIDAFAERSPFPAYLEACRSWAYRSAPDKAVYAIAWAYSVRQLQYPGVDRTLAIDIAESARMAFLDR